MRWGLTQYLRVSEVKLSTDLQKMNSGVNEGETNALWYPIWLCLLVVFRGILFIYFFLILIFFYSGFNLSSSILMLLPTSEATHSKQVFIKNGLVRAFVSRTVPKRCCFVKCNVKRDIASLDKWKAIACILCCSNLSLNATYIGMM